MKSPNDSTKYSLYCPLLENVQVVFDCNVFSARKEKKKQLYYVTGLESRCQKKEKCRCS